MVVDCSNVFMLENPVAALRAAGQRMSVCHVSDAWKSRWAHTSIGTGEIDFVVIVDTLASMNFDGPTIYELMDADDPRPRMNHDLCRLGDYSWQRHIATSLAA